ncbi:hypothetical protein DAI22_11g181750 [Oryza sativa Japonica Group]|nr:hypothetical protein DAI22_11g181750 [Oryza sativa Japonica Group]
MGVLISATSWGFIRVCAFIFRECYLPGIRPRYLERDPLPRSRYIRGRDGRCVSNGGEAGRSRMTFTVAAMAEPDLTWYIRFHVVRIRVRALMMAETT